MPLSPRQGLPVLAAVCLAALILPLSFSAGAMATPAIGKDLGGSATLLTWITNGFMLTFGGLLMVAGAMADRVGRKRMFITGVGLFALASLALAGAPSTLVIDLLRGVQGMGAAAALSGGSAALAQEFEGAARARAFSMLGTTFGVGLAFGPIMAGMLIQSLGWRAIFLATALIAASAFLLARAWMRESKAPGGASLDWGGAVTFTAALSVHLRRHSGAGQRMGQRHRPPLAGSVPHLPRRLLLDRDACPPPDARPLAVSLSALCRRATAAGGDLLWLCRAAGAAPPALHRRRRAERNNHRPAHAGDFRADGDRALHRGEFDALAFGRGHLRLRPAGGGGRSFVAGACRARR